VSGPCSRPNRQPVTGAKLRAEYEAGASTPQLAERYGWSVSWVKKQILAAGGQMRSPAEGLHRRRADDLAAYKRRHRLLDRADLERVVGCSASTVTAHADQLAAEGLAVRYADEGWNAKVDRWLYRRPAEQRLRELIAEADQHRAEGRERARIEGRMGRPRTGVWKECERCGRPVYEQPGRRRRFCSLACRSRALWPPSLALVLDPIARVHWGGRLAKQIATARGKRVGRPGPDDQTRHQIHQLREQGLSQEAIALRLGLTRSQVKRVLERH
jgi:DNA-binding MarR family transcriptional regulator